MSAWPSSDAKPSVVPKIFGWLGREDVVMRFEYIAGERMFVDFCGDTLPITDPNTGEIWQAQVFACALGASGYLYVEVTGSQDLAVMGQREGYLSAASGNRQQLIDQLGAYQLGAVGWFAFLMVRNKRL